MLRTLTRICSTRPNQYHFFIYLLLLLLINYLIEIKSLNELNVIIECISRIQSYFCHFNCNIYNFSLFVEISYCKTYCTFNKTNWVIHDKLLHKNEFLTKLKLFLRLLDLMKWRGGCRNVSVEKDEPREFSRSLYSWVVGWANWELDLALVKYLIKK